jgi:hypothetical protein
MKTLLLFLLLSVLSYGNSYEELSKKIIRELNYIYQGRSYSGASTFAKETKFKYEFEAVSKYEIEIKRSIDGIALDKPFIIDLRKEYYVELEPDNKCDPAIIISHELDIIYLYVKDRCGHFGGFNLYKRAETATVLLKQYFYAAHNLMEVK